MNPVIKLIRDTLTAQRWTWGFTEPHSPSYNDVESSIAELASHLKYDGKDDVSTGGMLLKSGIVAGETDVYVQVGVLRNGRFLEVFPDNV